MHHYFSLHAACLCIQVFNWVKDFFDGHVHCTECRIDLVIRASVFKVLALVPVAFLVTAVDLLPVHDRNRIIKIADDIIS